MEMHTKRDPANVDSPSGSGDSGGQIYTLTRSTAKGLRPGPSLEKQHLWASAPELLEAVKLAYRKHHLEDDTIGWDELSDKLLDALCNAIGPHGYLEWVQPYQRSQED